MSYIRTLFRHPLAFFASANVLLFALLSIYKNTFELGAILIGLTVLALTFITYFIITKFKWGDPYIFLITSMLVNIGIAMLYRLNPTLGTKQIGWYVLGIITYLLVYAAFQFVPIWHKLKWMYFGVSMGLFILVLLVGTRISGAKNWLSFGEFSFQPSEVIKILFVLFFACYYCNPRPIPKKSEDGKPPTRTLLQKLVSTLLLMCFCGFLILQREWGSTVLLFLTFLALLYIYEHDFKLILINLCGMTIVGSLGVLLLRHIQIRFTTWLDPWATVDTSGFQIAQSLFAIAAGDFFGTGLGLGMPNLIPEVYSDFIFAAICEEFGIFGGVSVVLLFFILIYRGFKIALKADGFYKCVALGMTILLGFQTFIIIGGVIKLIPLTGITLPFISYGGSSLLASFAMVGILQAISVERKN